MLKTKTWRKLHRYVGLFCALWLLVLAASGLVLSFNQYFSLEHYFYSANTVTVDTASQRIIIDNGYAQIQGYSPSVRCASPLVGATDYAPTGVLIVCQNQLYWLSERGEMIESQTISLEFLPLVAAYYAPPYLILDSATGLLQWNPERSQFETSNVEFDQTQHQALTRYQVEARSWWSWVHSLHTGLVAGEFGRWLFRLVGVGLIILCFSGIKNALRW